MRPAYANVVPAMRNHQAYVPEGLRQYCGKRISLATLKIDGEYQMGVYDGDTVELYSKYGIMRTDFKAATQTAKILKDAGVRECRFDSELYATDHDNNIVPFNLGQSIVKGSTSDEGHIRLMVFDIPFMDGKKLTEEKQWDFIRNVFPNWNTNEPIKVSGPKFWNITKFEDLVNAFEYCKQTGNEGLVLHPLNAKLKVQMDVDAVIIERKFKGTVRGRSYLVALMTESGKFVEIGHFGNGLTLGSEREIVNALEPYKLPSSNEDYCWYEPKVIVKLIYHGILPTTGRNQVYRYMNRNYEGAGVASCGHLRMPIFDSIRKDKSVNPKDLRVNQLGIDKLVS